MTIYEESIKLHKEKGGKIGTENKISLKNAYDLSLAYTPGVAGVCKAIYEDKKKVHELTIKKNTVAIVTDGSAVLGLGNIGPEAALPVMEGKAALFKRFGDIDAFPICLNTQDTEEIIKTVKNIAPVFGGINLEDISAPRCFEIEKRLRKELDVPVMHDDQHGTATVVLAGIINALKLRNVKSKSEVRVVISGAGSAGVAVTEILLTYGIKNITVCDSRGIICDSRKDLNNTKRLLARRINTENKSGSMEDALVDSDIFIGMSAPNILSQKTVETMEDNPIIFALANPDPEITPEDAYSAGAYIVATGRSDYPNQVNNVLAFPGLFRALLGSGKQFESSIFVIAAKAIANSVDNLSVNNIIPNPFDEGIVENITTSIEKIV